MVKKHILIVVALLSPVALHAADQISPAEQRLREGLKTMALQVRAAQEQVSTLEATKAENEQKIKDLDAQVAKTTAEKQAADKNITDLNSKVYDQELQVAQLKEALEKWKKSQNEAVALARTKEEQRAKLAMQVILFQRRIDEQQAKNQEMFRLGNEILTRYERFGLGEAVTAREPFVGITRVKFQNLIQDYQDKIVDQKIKSQ